MICLCTYQTHEYVYLALSMPIHSTKTFNFLLKMLVLYFVHLAINYDLLQAFYTSSRIFVSPLIPNVAYLQHETFSFMSHLAMSLERRFCLSRKGGTGGGGWVHLKGANSMVVSGLCGRKAW